MESTIPSTPSVAEALDNYMSHVYGHVVMVKGQKEQLAQAFTAGFAIALGTVSEISRMKADPNVLALLMTKWMDQRFAEIKQFALESIAESVANDTRDS